MFLAENDGNTTAEAKPVEGQIVEIPLSELHTFENHPFRVVDDENMEEMVESVKEYGVLVPAIARPRAEGGYELISGHRRKHASELAGKDTMPVIVRDCDNDEAVVIMVDANIQREDILVSERAKAYQMKYEAMKHQGKAQGNSLQEMSEQAGESMKTIQRLICIASLDEKLLAMVDEKKLGLRQGVDLSFIPQEQQRIVYEVISEMGVSLSQEQSARIKELLLKWTIVVRLIKRTSLMMIQIFLNRISRILWIFYISLEMSGCQCSDIRTRKMSLFGETFRLIESVHILKCLNFKNG